MLREPPPLLPVHPPGVFLKDGARSCVLLLHITLSSLSSSAKCSRFIYQLLNEGCVPANPSAKGSQHLFALSLLLKEAPFIKSAVFLVSYLAVFTKKFVMEK